MTALARLLIAATIGLAALTAAWAGEGRTPLSLAIDRALSASSDSGGPGARILTEALERAERDGETLWQRAIATYYLGDLLLHADRPADAETALREAVRLNEAANSGPETLNELKIRTMALMAETISAQGAPARAAEVLEQVLAMKARFFGPTSRQRVLTLQIIATTLDAADRLADAEGYWRTALTIATETGLLADQIAYQRRNLAANLDRQGRADEAARIRAEAK